MRLVLLALVAVVVVAVVAFALRRSGARDADPVDRLIAEANVLDQYGKRREAIRLLEDALAERGENVEIRRQLDSLRR
jgi:signal transduction histidine kinase